MSSNLLHHLRNFPCLPCLCPTPAPRANRRESHFFLEPSALELALGGSVTQVTVTTGLERQPSQDAARTGDK